MIINKVTSTIICLIYISVITAAVITVDNRVPSIGDYTDISAAHDAASDDDTLLVYPSQSSYGNISVSKPLHIIGPGHREGSSDSSSETATIGPIFFNDGSDGSVFEGFKVYNNCTYVYANDIVIRNNYLFNTYDYCLEIGEYDNPVTNVVIQGNKIIGSNSHYTGGGGNTWSESGIIRINHGVNTLFYANIILNTYGNVNQQNISGVSFNDDDLQSIVIFNNNIFSAADRPITNVKNNLITCYNNIFQANQLDYEYSSFYAHNIFTINCNTNYIPEENNNDCNVDISTVFKDLENYDFHLSEDSPAIGTGVNGVDMGIYGGDAPYIDGGFPSLPAIIDLNSDIITDPSNSLNIEFKAKGN